VNTGRPSAGPKQSRPTFPQFQPSIRFMLIV
jgi:hypothetical protein